MSMEKLENQLDENMLKVTELITALDSITIEVIYTKSKALEY